MPTTPNMSLVMPTEGGDADVWDTLLNTIFGVIDAHDHTTGKGVPVPSAALKINADVPWAFGGTAYAITGAKAFDFAETSAASVAAYSGALFLNQADSELYFRSVSGVNIKITDGSTLNVSIVGGIGGDYAAVEALLDYDDATDTYRARQEESAGVRQFAKFSIADLIIREYDAAGDASVPANTVTIKSPDALAASYAITLPTALPPAVYPMQVDSAGAITTAEPFGVALEAPAFNVTVPYTVVIPGSMSIDAANVHTKKLSAASVMIGWTIAASTGRVVFPLDLKVDDTVVAYTLYVDKQTNGAANIASRIYSYDGTGGGESALAAGDSRTDNAPGLVVLEETGIEVTIEAGKQYNLVFTPSGSITSNPDVTLHLEVQVKQVL